MKPSSINTADYFETIRLIGIEKLSRGLRLSHTYILKQTCDGTDWSKFGRDDAFTRLATLIFKKLQVLAIPVPGQSFN